MKPSLFLLPFALLPITFANHNDLLSQLQQRQHRSMEKGDASRRELDQFLRKLSLAARAPPAADDDDDDKDGGLLGGILGGGSNGNKGTTTTGGTTTRPGGGKTSVSASDDGEKETGSASASARPTGSSNSTSATSSAHNSTSSAVSTTSASSSVPSSSVMTTASLNEEGETVIVTKFLTSATSAQPTQSAAGSQSDAKKDDSPISTPAIIGISVGAGVVVLSLVACAIWRMKKRSSDEDEAIRWPELNRHGDADTHHALPARVTGQHGIETNPLERSLSNSSSIFAHSSVAPPHSAPPMTLNGSGFGAASSLDDYAYNEKSDAPPVPSSTLHTSPPPVYYGGSPPMDHDEDYSNLPPAVQSHTGMAQGGPGMAYDSEPSEGDHPQQMSMAQGHGQDMITPYYGR